MSETPSGCRGFEADLSALLDGELAPERAAELRAHLAACADCRERLAGLARVDAALSAAPLPAVPASLRARLEARLESAGQADTLLRRTRRAPAPRRAGWGRAAGALAAAAAGVALYLAVATREPARLPETAPAPPQIARPLEEAPRELPREAPQVVVQAPQAVAKLPAPAPPAPVLPEPPVPAPQPPVELDLATVPEDELGLALEIETVEDLDVIGNLDLLELVLASEAG
jgi:anti-sigma factor RsiW